MPWKRKSLFLILTLSQLSSCDTKSPIPIVAVLSDVELSCPEGWNRLGQKCLKIYNIQKSWGMALSTCARYGAQLARLESSQENNFVASLLSRPGRGSLQEYWIGLISQQQIDDVVFVWSDGSPTSRYVGFWEAAQPDYTKGECTMVTLLKADLTWKLNMCNLLRPFLCELPACVKGSFFCSSGSCISESQHCNGINDCGDFSDELNCPASHSDIACLKYEKGEAGKISSPNYPSSYKGNANCRWVIEGPINSRIQLTFDYFETEEFVDIVTVLDGGPAENSSTVLATLSGSKPSQFSLFSSSNTLIIRFRSDPVIQARGFQAQWRAVPFSCGGSLTAQAYGQTFSSPSYPSDYPHEAECVWTIQAAKGQLITLSIEDLSLSPDDSLVIYDGESPSSPILAKFSNTLMDTEYLISTQNNVYVYFLTDRQESRRGFSIGYKRGCDVVFRQTYGTLLSPGSTRENYPNSIRCTYTIELPENAAEQALSLYVNRFDVAVGDYVKVFEGSAKGRALHEGDGFNAENKPPRQMFSRQGRVQVVMETNSVRSAVGFNITFSHNCPNLRPPLLASLSTKTNAYGTKVTVSCPVGFEFSSGRGRSFDVVCQLGGKWTEDFLPTCQAVYCSAVPQIANGFAMSASNVTFGGVAKYSCYEGFSFLSGNNVEEIHCTDEGNWTPPPTCKAATCPALPPFANGDRHLQYGDGTGYGTVFAFVCRPGYSREGAATLLCKADGQWSFEQPHCNKLTCSYIPRITNGRLSRPEPFQFGDSARLQCDPGFRVDGPEEVKCLANQSLSVVPSCRDIDECSEGLAQCVNSSTLCVNLPGGYTCQCLNGFQPQLVCPKPSSLPSSSVFASSEAVPVSLLYSSGWCATKTDPQRSVTLHYSVPKVIEKIRFEKVMSGETTSIKIMYSEEEGLPLKEFVVNGQDVFPLSTVGSVGGDVFMLPYSIECRVLQISIITSKGEPCMKTEVLGCQKASCIDTNECMVNNGYCDQICVNHQGSYKCACREGYDLFLENGQGGVNLEEGETGEDPHDIIRFNKTCVPRACPPVQPLENGKLLSTLKTFHYPIVVRFQCDFGYQMMGPDFIQCLSDGSWNGTTPFCLPATCQGLKNNSAIGLFVSPENNTIAYGQNVSIFCSQQNRPARPSPLSSFRQCIFDPQPDGRDYWLAGPPTDCLFVDCGEPPELAGVVYEGDHSNYKVGSAFTFSCPLPYSLVGKSSFDDHTVRCTVDGTWDLGDLRCEGPVCVDPGFPDDGSIELNSVEEGAIATFTCNRPGFKPFPAPSIQCALGAACVLSEDVGISSGFIPDGAFADNSDSTNWGYEPHKSRLSSTGWCGSKDAFIFLSVDLQRIYTLTTLRMAGVAGSGYLRGHVTKMQLFYKTQFSHNYDTYPVEFETPSGNHNAIHQFELSPPLRARYVLLGVAEYEGNPCIRFDLLGCLAPLTVSHEIPSHLQVGWNGSVPQCIDAEPPMFINCPTSPIFTTIDENGQIRPVHFEEPKAEDNSGRVAFMRIEPSGFVPGRYVSTDTDVVYTAFDDAGNTAECTVKLRIPDTLPPVMKCPDSYSLAAVESEVHIVFNQTTVPMVIQDVSKITEVIFTPSEAYLKASEFMEVEVTATDALSNRNKCRFQVAYMPAPCSPESLSSASHVIKTCTQKDSKTICTVSCEKGHRFIDHERVSKNFSCEFGHWSPSGIAPACVPIAMEPARYELSVAISSPVSSPVPDHCLKGYEELASRMFDSLDNVLSQRCSSSVQVFVRFIDIKFHNESGMVNGNYTIQILPTVLQNVFYDLCGLTLRTIFDLRIPGATTPIRSLLSLNGEAIPSQGTGCPLLTASRSAISQGFGCAEGEVLRHGDNEQLPECLPCPVGSVNVNNTCLQCPLGSYQDEAGKLACKACPDGTYTLDQGAHSPQSCLAVCGNGMYSDSGLIPCQLCPRHTYSGPPILGGYKQCTSCPSGSYTARLGSAGPSQCKQPCQPGTFSVSGLEPCSLCPMHHYQPALGQQRCLQCSNETATTSEGQGSESACEPVDCTAKQCENRAECTIRDHRAVCECRPGYVGERCEQLEPVCDSRPCFNGGQCEAIAGTFRCICPQNFTGSKCQFGPDECIGVSCPNGGVCHDLPGLGTNKCLCRSGFAGPDCAEISDICTSANPCKNGADCTPSQLGRFKCKCLPGWEGQTCEKNIDDCADSPCALNASCIDFINDYECICPKGFQGKRCNIKEDLCASSPCVNGLCVDTLFNRKCVCEEGWTGPNCETNIDDCAQQPCQNGGSCTDKIAGFSCSCPAGYRGVRCQHLVDHCANSPCRNNAFCSNLGPSYHCSCPLGFNGTHCEHNMDECLLGKCSKQGTESCEDGINTFICVCKPGYSGEFCETRIDQCASLPCLNNGTCHDIGGSFRCDCASGWNGERCEQEKSSCDSRPCRNDGHCVNLVGDYFCVCPEGVSGKDCEVAPNRCLGEPCLNGGVCGDFGSRLECSCPKKFTGSGCQYELDACAAGVCQNGGECTRTHGEFICKCQPGFSGNHCETNLDDCSASTCPLVGTCVDQINSAQCLCPFNMTGSNCDKAIDVDYDLHFFDSLRPSHASLAVPFLIEGNKITVSLWIKFSEPQSKGVVLTMYNSQQMNYSSSLTEVLRVDSDGVYVSLISEEPALQLHFPFTQRINDGAWNHLVLTWSSDGGEYSLIWNSIRIFADNGYGVNKELEINSLITLGTSVRGEPVFAGSVTRVHVWNRVLDFESEIPLMSVSCQGAEIIYDGLLLHFNGYTKMEGKVERVPRSTCGREKRKIIHQPPIQVQNCPADQFVTTSLREVNISWPEPVFYSINPIEKVEKNLKQSQIFTWGEYDVFYVARDNSSNTAQCSFKLHISRDHCLPMEDPVNGVQACESWGPRLRYKACSITCREGFEFSRSPAVFYTCGADGEWRPRKHNKILFHYPQCTKSVPATRMIILRVFYPASSLCNEAGRDALKSKLLASLNSINQKWNMCSLTDNSGCVGARINVDCSPDAHRSKRENHSFKVTIELPVKRNMVSDSANRQKLLVVDAIQNEILLYGAFNLEKVLPNGRPDLSTFELLDEFHCQSGQVAVNDVCVPCAPGSYHSLSTSQCELCAEGDYQPQPGRNECLHCPSGFITAGEGAISEQECKPKCPPGHFLNISTSLCTPCGLGFFQSRGGAFECIACGVGKTTLSERTTSEDECRDECLDGDQLSSSGTCQPCPIGSYRTRGEHKHCILCPPGTTTESISSTRREQCNTPRCTAGQFLIKETKYCQFCPRGTFQDEEQQTKCKLCPTDHTTAAHGATAESQCYSTNQCTTGEDNCSWHALCIDLPDENDTPTFQCKCKPGYRGNGTHCYDACTNFCLNDGVCKKNPVGYVECICKENFSGERCEERFQPKSQRVALITVAIGGVVAILVIIVIIIFMISFRFNRVDETQTEKVQIEELQQSNFIYGRPAIEHPRPVGYYYEDDDEYESKAVYVSGEEDNRELEQRMRLAQKHMYRPGINQAE